MSIVVAIGHQAPPPPDAGARAPRAPAAPASPSLAAPSRAEARAPVSDGHDVRLRPGDSPRDLVIVVRDRRSGEVILQIPPEELMRLRERMQDLLKAEGLLVDTSS